MSLTSREDRSWREGDGPNGPAWWTSWRAPRRPRPGCWRSWRRLPEAGPRPRRVWSWGSAIGASMEAAKARLLAILATAAGSRTQAEACLELGLSDRRFHALRGRMLQSALDGLAPRPAGRPHRTAAATDDRVRELEAIVRELRLDLQAAQVREEIALVMPRLLQRGRATKGARQRAPPSGPHAKRVASRGSEQSERAQRRAARIAAARPVSAPLGTGSATPGQAPSPSAAGR